MRQHALHKLQGEIVHPRFLGDECIQDLPAVVIAVLGSNGLDINDSDEKYTLKALPGRFSGLHLLAIMFTAFRQIDPAMETGADFDVEYDAALKMRST